MNASLKILWLKSGPLHPLDTGGKIRTYNMLRALKAQHHLAYLALCLPETADAVKKSAMEYSHEQIWIPWRETPKRSAAFFVDLAKNIFSPLPYAIAKYRSAEMESKISELDRAGKFDLIICDFLVPSVNLPRKLQTPTLLFQHNVEALIWKRTFETAGSPLKKIYFREQWRRMRNYEGETSARFSGVVGVSEEDCQLMRSEYGLDNVLGAVPTGVDMAHFEKVQRAPKPNTIAFLGSMDWMPNIDAVQFFVQEILPLVKKEIPDVKLTVIGRNPPPAISELAKDAAIRITGTVPDVRPFLAEAQALVVPLRVGGGTRIKIFEAIAAGIPVVSTRIGMEGLPLTDRENILIADAPADFARALIELLRGADLANKISQNASHLVREKFSWEAVTKIFSDYCHRAAGR